MDKWLTRDYVAQLLSILHPNTEFVSFSITQISNGPRLLNYVGRLLINWRTDQGKPASQTYILKTFALEDITLKSEAAFNIEVHMYKNVLSSMQKSLNLITTSCKLAPSFVHVDKDHHALYLEDLSSKVSGGWSNKEITSRLDMDELRSVADHLAKFHAASLCFSPTGAAFADYCKPQYRYIPSLIKIIFVCLAKHVESWDGYHEYASKIHKMSDSAMKYILKAYAANRVKTSVLTHGDLWINNMMFHKSKEGHLRVCLVDFQTPVFSSPVCDLMNVYYLCGSDEVKTTPQSFARLLEVYQHTFSDTMQKFGKKKDIPSYSVLRMEYKSKEFLSMAFEISSWFLLDPDRFKINMATVMNDPSELETIVQRLYQQEAVTEKIRKLLPIWDAKGILDPIQ